MFADREEMKACLEKRKARLEKNTEAYLDATGRV
jgi:hypothetical protein